MSANLSRDMAAEQEAVIVIENERGEVCHTICPAILLLNEIRTMNNFHRQGPVTLDVTLAGAARV
jgi:hypothetical protein